MNRIKLCYLLISFMMISNSKLFKVLNLFILLYERINKNINWNCKKEILKESKL